MRSSQRLIVNKLSGGSIICQTGHCSGETSCFDNDGMNQECNKTHRDGLLQDAYDRLWESKLDDPEWVENDGKGRVAYCAEFLKANKMISIQKRILDVGCGRGTLGYYLEGHGCLYGADVSKTAILEARKIYKQAECIDIGREQLSYLDEFFDVAVCLDVIEHVFDPIALLKEVHRVLKTGAEIILSTPNILNENLLKTFVHTRRFPKTSGDSFPYDGGHIHFFTYQDIFHLMLSVGFSPEPIGPLKSSFDYEFKEPLVWVLGRKS